MRTYAYSGPTALATLLAAIGCSSSSFPIKDQCSSNGDCLSGFVCVQQTCVSSSSTPKSISFAVVQQPTNIVAGLLATPAWVFKVTGADNVTLTSDTGQILGTTTQPVINGLATFADLKFTVSGTHKISANFANQTASNSITVAPGAVSSLVIGKQPVDALVEQNIPPVTIGYGDDYGNLTGTFPGNIDVSIVDAPTGGLLQGVTSSVPGDNVMTFSGLVITEPGSNYKLRFTSGAYSVDSNTFTIHQAAWTPLVSNGKAMEVIGAATAPPGGSGHTWLTDGTTLYWSSDAGTTLNALPTTPTLFKYIAEDPFNPNNLAAIEPVGDFVANSATSSILWMSSDSGQTWASTKQDFTGVYFGLQRVAFDPNVSGRLYSLGADTILFRSEDGGLNWASTNQIAQALTVARNGQLYISTGSHLLRSEDGGRNWLQLNPKIIPLPSVNNILYFPQLTTDATETDIVYAQVESAMYSLYVSRDAGMTWEPLEISPGSSSGTTALLSCQANGQTATYAGTSIYDLEVSTDHGATWSSAAWNLPVGDIALLACDPQDVSHIFAVYPGITYMTKSAGQ